MHETSERQRGYDKDREGRKTHTQLQTHTHTPACPSMGHPAKTAGEERSKAHQIYLEVHWSRCEEEEGGGGMGETWLER